MTEPTAILCAIRDSVARIEAMLGEAIERKRAPRKKANKTAARERGLCDQGRADCVDELGISEILRLWKEVCPRHVQPIKLTDVRKLALHCFWRLMNQDLEAIQGVFEAVAASRFLSHPPKGFVTLFWTVAEKNLTELMEKKYQ